MEIRFSRTHKGPAVQLVQSECARDDVAEHGAQANADRREYSDVGPVAGAEARHLVLRAALHLHRARETRRVRAHVERLLQLELLLRQLLLLPFLSHAPLFFLHSHFFDKSREEKETVR